MKKSVKIVLILGILAVIVGIMLVILKSSGIQKEPLPAVEDKPELPALYIITAGTRVDEDFLRTQIYLKDTQMVRFHVPHEEEKITHSDRVLDGDSFVALIDDLVRSGYLSFTIKFTALTISERHISEDEKNIVITDTGREVTHNDAPPFQTWTTNISLKYRYSKQTGDIYFSSTQS